MLSDPAVKAFYREMCVGRQRAHNVLIAELLKKETPPGADNIDKNPVVVYRKVREDKK